jgi:hypothetical protein
LFKIIIEKRKIKNHERVSLEEEKEKEEAPLGGRAANF